jgi:hypothetical protein
MKKIILITYLMMPMLARGQGYVPIIKDDAIWSVSHLKFTFKGDTMINDHNLQEAVLS